MNLNCEFRAVSTIAQCVAQISALEPPARQIKPTRGWDTARKYGLEASTDKRRSIGSAADVSPQEDPPHYPESVHKVHQQEKKSLASGARQRRALPPSLEGRQGYAATTPAVKPDRSRVFPPTPWSDLSLPIRCCIGLHRAWSEKIPRRLAIATEAKRLSGGARTRESRK